MSLPDESLIENMDNVVGLFLIGASLLLPILCLRILKIKPVAFLVSIVPAACIIWSFLSAGLVTRPFYVRDSDTKRIAKGMTEAQVRQTIGSPRGSSSGDRKTRLTYDFQIAWGSSPRQFFVDLIDDKVVSARFMRYGGEPSDDFFESDFVKDLKAGKALPNKVEVEQACLAVCKKEVTGTVGVEVSDMDLCLLDFERARATGNVVVKYADGASNSLSKPFTIVLAKGPAGWHAAEYELMGAKGIVQQGGATNGSQPFSSGTNTMSSATGKPITGSAEQRHTGGVE
ncbi:MAG: hypothetical protein ACXWKH_07650 [Limisphaerales bacterium]